MKNRVLFVLSAVRMGGSATSMLNLLELFAEKGEKKDLFLLEHDGLFIEKARTVANLLPEDKLIASTQCEKKNLGQRGTLSFIIRVGYVVIQKIFCTIDIRNMIFKWRAKRLKGYDIVISFQEEKTTEFTQFIPAKRHVAWCHMDYKAFTKNRTKAYQQNLYDRFDDIVCVSEYARQSILENLVFDEKHVHLIYNTIPSAQIIKQAREPIAPIEKKKYTFVSMGRFVKRKNFERAVEATVVLKNKNVDFIWYILGNGEEFENIQRLIQENHIEKHLVLLGMKENPFPYVANADCFVLTSETEAQPMVLNEALTLNVPVICTDFSSSREVVKDGINGIIVENSANGITEGLLRFIGNKNLREQLKKGATEFFYDNDGILRQIEEIVNGY